MKNNNKKESLKEKAKTTTSKVKKLLKKEKRRLMKFAKVLSEKKPKKWPKKSPVMLAPVWQPSKVRLFYLTKKRNC